MTQTWPARRAKLAGVQRTTELAVNGTVNDLAVSAAVPRALVITFVLEAGLPGSVLEAEVRAIEMPGSAAGVGIVGGDTKVVEYRKADGMYITTAGIGMPIHERSCRRKLSGPRHRLRGVGESASRVPDGNPKCVSLTTNGRGSQAGERHASCSTHIAA